MIKKLLLILLVLATVCSCRQDDEIIPDNPQKAGTTATADEYVGMYVLNEGNMGSNKCTLDYYDFAAGVYTADIYPTRNPGEVMELGDVGNDIKTYGSRLWMVINCSNKVEVANAYTAKSLGHVNIPNCRHLAFSNGYAYVSSYVGKVNGKSVQGAVYKVDTTSLKVVDTCMVGYQPEEMAVVGNQLFVANSGGYSGMQGLGYDNRVSVISLDSFKVDYNIKVASNLLRVRADKYGRLWVTTQSNFVTTSALYMLKRDKQGRYAVADSINTPVTDFAFAGDSLVYFGSTWDMTAGATYSYGIINITTGQNTVMKSFGTSTGFSVTTPYAIAMNPANGDFYLADATNYVSNGKLLCFSHDLKYKWTVTTGDIPGHICFVKKQ